MQSASINTPKISDDGPLSNELSSNPEFKQPATEGGGTIWGEKPWDF